MSALRIGVQDVADVIAGALEAHGVRLARDVDPELGARGPLEALTGKAAAAFVHEVALEISMRVVQTVLDQEMDAVVAKRARTKGEDEED